MYRYNASVVRVIDGDTFIANVDLGFRVYHEITFRLARINTPETWRPKTEEERELGQLAKDRVIELIEFYSIVIETSKAGKYGRWIAEVYLPELDDKNLTDLLIEEGHEK